MGTRIAVNRVSRRTKVMAVAAAGAVLIGGIGVTSLAAWTDQEYVQGGVGGTAGIASTSFDVIQHVASDSAGVFTSRSTAGAAGVVDFSSLASTLSPSTTVYGYVQLKTNTSSIGGTLNLKSATSNSGLAQYLTYGAVLVPDTTSCSSTGFSTAYGTSTNILAATGTAMNANGTQSFTLSAAGAQTKTVCFAITMPAGTTSAAMGLTLSPVWYFDAISS